MLFFPKKTALLDDVIVDGIAKRPFGLPSSERRKLLRQLRSPNPELATSARFTLDSVYLQLLSAVAHYCLSQANCVGLSTDEVHELTDELIKAGREGVLQEMREPSEHRSGEPFALRVVIAAQKSMDHLLWEKKTHERKNCSN